MHRVVITAVLAALACGTPAIASAQTAAAAAEAVYSHWPEDLRIGGRLVVFDGAADVAVLQPTLERVASGQSVFCLGRSEDAGATAVRDALEAAVGENGSYAAGSPANASAELLAAVAAADCVFVAELPSDPKRLAAFKAPLHAVVRRGGTLIAEAPVARRFGKRYVTNGDASSTAAGLNLLPDCILDASLGERELLQVLEKHPRSVGLHLADEAAFVLAGRKVIAIGPGAVTVCVTQGTAEESASLSISAPTRRRRNPESVLFDLTQWRRMAIDRDLPPFPGESPPPPVVEHGTLLIVGGGGSPRGLTDRFVELAGGVEHARLVYVPCSENDSVGERHGIVESWRRMGVEHATFVHTKDRRQADTDEKFLTPLREATGIYFGGGRQWNFSDSYYGTRAHRLMKDVLRRGGVIAGSSAGASIQGRYLARATPIGNADIMAPGYERGGLGFLPGVAIDQHFSQRGRQPDLTELIAVYPQLLGIGLDEATAIEVRGSVAEVTGRGRAFFYDAGAERAAGDPDYTALPAGSSYDLARRAVLHDARESPDEPSGAERED
ncbi:cyanophycinase [Alienimonas chondri]|uniref:Cyanophycinase n=1 Tax=Alienimonas chondri TaxID=2681879 RepID=A0ABX1VE36_9PLAN|nr:cyanophycinase [Alienimonas chondri]NNJ26364.1 hypothetical protein [Alienimonas chondri]